MKTQNPLDIARSQLEAFNHRNWEACEDALTPNSVYDEVGTGRKLKGKKEIVGALKGWTEAFPDVKGTIQQSFVHDDTAVVEITYQGTQKGKLMAPTGPVPPTGKKINVRCLELYRVRDGRIVESHNFFDMLSMLQALDAIPGKAAKKAGA